MSDPPYVTIRARRGGDGSSVSSASSTVCNAACPDDERVDDERRRWQTDVNMEQHAPDSAEYTAPSATHDTSRVNYHVKHIDTFAKTLEDVRSAKEPVPDGGRRC